MKNFIANFCFDQDGAVTVDFVALTAAICTLGFVVLALFSEEAIALANYVRDQMDNMSAG